MNQQWYQDTWYDEERNYDTAADYYYYENDADDDFGALRPWSTPVQNQYSSFMFWREFTLITEQCALPAVRSTYWWSSHVGVTLVASICFRILILFFQRFRCLSNWVLHVVCAACGLAPALISSSTKEDGAPHHWWVPAALIVGYMVILYSISLLTILLGKNNKKQEKCNAAVVFLAVILTLLMYREYVLNSSRAWQSTRGTHMLMSMKAVALILDFRSGRLNKLPSIAEYTGYMLCAGCAQLGPYISYKQYLQAFHLPPSTYSKNLKQWVVVIKNLGLSMAWFMGSVCYVDWLLDTSYYSYYGIAIAVDTYRRAASYRSGHYFVAALGTTNAQACGYHSKCDERIVTAKPSSVEWPKQMSYVASAWDIPTHQWLKTYVFDKVYSNGKAPIAAAATFAVSCAIHGFEIRVSAVLAMIGICAYVELLLRKRLATKFPNILGKESNIKKTALSTRTVKWIRILINMLFVVLNIIHLSYLGAIMEASNDTESVFFVWHRCAYIGHLLLFFTYIIAVLL